MRFLLYLLGDESVPIPRPGPDAMAEYGKLVEEATTAGVLLMNGGIAPTSMGSKVTRADGDSPSRTDRSPRPRSWSAAGR